MEKHGPRKEVQGEVDKLNPGQKTQDKKSFFEHAHRRRQRAKAVYHNPATRRTGKTSGLRWVPKRQLNVLTETGVPEAVEMDYAHGMDVENNAFSNASAVDADEHVDAAENLRRGIRS